MLERTRPVVDGPTVFLVDDDVSVRESLAPLLRWAGWDVKAYQSARDFLARKRVDAPSCLLLDLQLEDASSRDLLRELDRRETPVILMTGHADVQPWEDLVEVSSVLLTKPFTDDTLLRAIREALRASECFRTSRSAPAAAPSERDG